MTDVEVGIYGFERPRPSGNDCSLSATALTKHRADGQNPGSGEGREGNPKFATISYAHRSQGNIQIVSSYTCA